MSVASAYARRNKWPGFYERWRAALETSYVRLEFALIENACNTFEPVIEFTPDLPMPPMRIDDAIQVLRLHRHSVRGLGNPLRQLSVLPSIEQVQAEITKKVAPLRRGRAAGLKLRGED
jgi:hypothetical protein